MLAYRLIGECSVFNPTSAGFKETSSYWSVQFFSAFHWSSSIDKARTTILIMENIFVTSYLLKMESIFEENICSSIIKLNPLIA